MIASAMVVGCIPSMGDVFAEDDNSEVKTTYLDEVCTSDEVSKKENCNTVEFIFPKGATLNLISGDDIISLHGDWSNNFTMSVNGSSSEVTLNSMPENVYQYGNSFKLVLEGEINTTIQSTITADEGYAIYSYSAVKDSGENIFSLEEVTKECSYDIVVGSENIKVLSEIYEAVNLEEESASSSNTSRENLSKEDLKKILDEEAEITRLIEEANLDLTVVPEVAKNSEPTNYKATRDYTEYDRVPAIGSSYKLGSLTTHFGSSVWQRTDIDVVDYWDGYGADYPWDIVDGWRRGVIGMVVNGEAAPMFCVEPGVDFKTRTRSIKDALSYYSQDVVTVLALIDKYVCDHRYEIELWDSGYKYESDRHSACYGMRQLTIWMFLERVYPKYPNGRVFYNHEGVKKTIHNAPVRFEANQQFINGSGNGFTHKAIEWALNNKDNYIGYGKIAVDPGNENGNQKCAIFKAELKPWIEIYKSPTSNGGWVNGVWKDGDSYAKYAVNGNQAYSLEGTKYTAWCEETGKYYYDCITTDSSGYGWCYLPPGHYQIQESVAPKGYQRDYTWYKVDLSAGNYTFYHSDLIKTGRIRLYKTDENGNVNPDMAGAKYGVWNWSGSVGNGNPEYTITVDENGFGQVWGLPLWKHYFIKEISAPDGYDFDTNVYTVYLDNPGSYDEISVDVNSKEPLSKVAIGIEKTSADGSITSGNDNYSLKGAEYDVYSDESLQSKVGTIVTDESGKGTLEGLRIGTYWIKEVKASPGFELDTTVHVIEAVR